MRKILLLIFTLLAAISTAFAQQKGKVSFVLIDGASKQAVIGAVVSAISAVICALIVALVNR